MRAHCSTEPQPAARSAAVSDFSGQFWGLFYAVQVCYEWMASSAPRELCREGNFLGTALRRGGFVDSSKAHTLADEIIDDLGQVEGKLKKLEQQGGWRRAASICSM